MISGTSLHCIPGEKLSLQTKYLHASGIIIIIIIIIKLYLEKV